MRKYAALNPADGSYTYVQSIEELKATIAQRAWAFFLLHTHNTPYTVVDVDEVTGAEVWHAPNGDLRLSPQQIQAEIKAQIAAEESF